MIFNSSILQENNFEILNRWKKVYLDGCGGLTWADS